MAKNTPATASDVRALAASKPELFKSLSDAERKCLGATARGRLHPKVIEVAQANGVNYVQGTKVAEKTVPVKVTKVDAKGKKRSTTKAVPFSEARAMLGADAPKRGVMSKDNLAKLGEILASR